MVKVEQQIRQSTTQESNDFNNTRGRKRVPFSLSPRRKKYASFD